MPLKAADGAAMALGRLLLLVFLSVVAAQPDADQPNVNVAAAIAQAAAAEARATALSRSCIRCPKAQAPSVCAEDAAGISMTVASRCLAECQQLTNIREGTCEELAAGGPPGSINVQSAALVETPGTTVLQPPAFAASCRPSSTLLKAMLLEGRVFVGCVQTAQRSPDGSLTPQTATPPPSNAVRVADLLNAAQGSDTVVVTERSTVGRAAAHFLRSSKTTVQQLRDAVQQAAAGGSGGSGIAGQGIPPAGPATDPSLLVGPSEGVVAGDAPPPNPQAGPVTAAAMPDNRFQVTSTTVSPYYNFAKLLGSSGGSSLVACSGTLISPDDVLTAAHCVRDSQSGVWYGPSYTVTPGKNGASEPYGRFTANAAVTWSVWVGAAYNGQFAVTAGSAYVDIAVIRMDTGTTWWYGFGYNCGSANYTIRACGYPGSPGGTNVPYCADGRSRAIDMCDGTSDYIRSNDTYTSSGQSGGPVIDRARNQLIGIVSGGLTDNSLNWFTAIDTYNYNFLMSTGSTMRNTIWPKSWVFRSTQGTIMSRLNNKCIDGFAGGASTGQPYTYTCFSNGFQQWQRPGSQDLRIRNAANGLCMSIASSTATNVQVTTCSTSNNQKWLYDHLGRLRPWLSPRKCVTVSSSLNGVYLTLSACVTDSNSQKWYT